MSTDAIETPCSQATGQAEIDSEADARIDALYTTLVRAGLLQQ